MASYWCGGWRPVNGHNVPPGSIRNTHTTPSYDIRISIRLNFPSSYFAESKQNSDHIVKRILLEHAGDFYFCSKCVPKEDPSLKQKILVVSVCKNEFRFDVQ